MADDHRPLNLVLLGPPGAGKSTIAESLIGNSPLMMVSTGQYLRDAVKARTTIGRQVRPYLESGNLVPDSLMDRVLRSILETLDSNHGLLLDGYPRTVIQAVGLLGALADYGRTLDAVLALEVADDVVIRRLSGRRMCDTPTGQFPIHIDDLTSMVRCRERGGRPIQRDDDKPEVVQQRLVVYHEQTAPLLAYYTEHGRVLHIDALGTPADVARRALAALGTVAAR